MRNMYVSVKEYARVNGVTRQAVLYMVKNKRFKSGEVILDDECAVCGSKLKFLIKKTAKWPKNLNCGKRG